MNNTEQQLSVKRLHPSMSKALLIIWIIFTANLFFKFSFIYEPLNIARTVLGYFIPIATWFILKDITSNIWIKRLMPLVLICAIGSFFLFFLDAFYDGKIKSFFTHSKHQDANYESQENLKTLYIEKNSVFITLDRITHNAIAPSDIQLVLSYHRYYFGILQETKKVCIIFPGSSGTIELGSNQDTVVLSGHPAGARKTNFIQVFSTDWNKVKPINCFG